jgi:hypothetical protein
MRDRDFTDPRFCPLATHNFEAEPVFLGTSAHAEFSVDEFKNNYDAVIVDPSGTLNLASRVTKSGLAQVSTMQTFNRHGRTQFVLFDSYNMKPSLR